MPLHIVLRYDILYYILRGCASSARVRRFGESPNPVEPERAAGTQPWSLDREAGFKRRQWSARAAMRKREAIQPRKIESAEAETLPSVAGSKNQSISETEEIPPGSKSVASAQGNTRVPGRSDRLCENSKGD